MAEAVTSSYGFDGCSSSSGDYDWIKRWVEAMALMEL